MWRVYYINSISHRPSSQTFEYWFQAQEFMDRLGMWFTKWEKLQVYEEINVN